MKRQKLLVILLLTIHFVKAQESSKPAFPAAAGWVTDNADMLMQQEEALLSQKISAFEKTTGNEISILTIKTVHPLSIEEYANRLFNQWGIGKKERNNGVLIMAAVQDRKMRIEVGDGLTGMLTNDTCAAIIRDQLQPAFRKGEFYKGFNDAVDTLINILNRETTAAGPLMPQPSGQTGNAGTLHITINDKPLRLQPDSNSRQVLIPVFIIGGVILLLVILFRSGSANTSAASTTTATPHYAGDQTHLYAAGLVASDTFTGSNDTGSAMDSGGSVPDSGSSFGGGESSGSGASGDW